MEGISDIKIVAIDSKRPPVIRKQPYIDLFFRLSHKVPKDWCEDFNALMSKQKFKTKIHPDEGLHIETWVGKPDDVQIHFNVLKKTVAECNEHYVAKVRLKASQKDGDNDALAKESGEQGRLNRIIAELSFDA